MTFTKSAYTVALLIVGLGLAVTPHSRASLLFNGSSSKAVLDGSYLDGTTHSNYSFEVWIKPFSLGGTLIGKMEVLEGVDIGYNVRRRRAPARKLAELLLGERDSPRLHHNQRLAARLLCRHQRTSLIFREWKPRRHGSGSKPY